MSININKHTTSIDKFFTKTINQPINISQNPKLEQDIRDSQDNTVSQDSQDSQDNIYIHDKSPYICDEKPYFFLNDNILSQTFGDFMKTDKEYNIRMCIYQINTTCNIPFIQYLFDMMSETYTFPNIRFQCPVSSNIQEQSPEQSPEQSQEHTFFMNTCSQELLKVLPIHELFNSELLQKMYKGFIEYEKILYVVFDSTYIDNVVDIDNTKYNWLIIDEIINQKPSITKVIDNEILDMFTKSPYMMYILDKMGNRIMQPELLYLCIRPNEIYMNVKKNENTESINIIDDTVEHSWFGDNSFFSSNPLEDTQVNQIKRYVVFTYNAKYILKDISQISQEDKDQFDANLEDNDISSIYFKENRIQLWCIQNTNQFTEI